MLSRALFALVTVAGLAQAELDLSKLKPQGYVSDFAGVIDARSKGELERYATLVKERTGAEMAFVTIPSLEGGTIEDIAVRLFEQWKIGTKGKDEGVLLLLAINDRRSRVEVGYGLEPILSAGVVGDTLRAMRPALKERQYGDAIIAAAAEMGGRIARDKGVALDGEPQPRVRRESEGIPPGLIFVGIIILIFVISAMNNNGRAGPRSGGMGPDIWYGGFPGGGRRWPRSGGGFGGYDSGGGGFSGGFGGFGGGSSGGGGASSDW